MAWRAQTSWMRHQEIPEIPPFNTQEDKPNEHCAKGDLTDPGLCLCKIILALASTWDRVRPPQPSLWHVGRHLLEFYF